MRKESNETEKLSGYLVSNLPYEDNEEFDAFIIKAFGARRELLAALISEQADYYRQRGENTRINKETIPTDKQELIKFNKANKYGYYFAKFFNRNNTKNIGGYLKKAMVGCSMILLLASLALSVNLLKR